jgi:hypothetical protein
VVTGLAEKAADTHHGSQRQPCEQPAKADDQPRTPHPR